MIGLRKLTDIFQVKYGNKFDANKMTFVEDGEINFISRNSNNNGCVGTVAKYNKTEPYDAGLITVSLGGSFLLSSFVQPKEFYTAQNVAVLIPRNELSLNEKIFYCKCISMNRFRYSAFGREANKTLKFLTVPIEVPMWASQYKNPNLSKLASPESNKKVLFHSLKLKQVKLGEIFHVVGTKTTPKKILEEKGKGKYPYITTQIGNNGVEGFYDFYTENGNVLIIDSAVKGYCTYQAENFTASDHTEKLIPKFEMNQYIALFLTKMINLEQYRYSYGRKFNQERIKNTVIKLPFEGKEPDWKAIVNFVKSLKYSKALN